MNTHKMAATFKAMAHPSRLSIIAKLQEKECCVCELNEIIACDVSTLSRHLTVLKNAGLIEDRKSGNFVFYRLCCACIGEIFQKMETFIEKKESL